MVGVASRRSSQLRAAMRTSLRVECRNSLALFRITAAGWAAINTSARDQEQCREDETRDAQPTGCKMTLVDYERSYQEHRWREDPEPQRNATTHSELLKSLRLARGRYHLTRLKISCREPSVHESQHT